MSTLRKKYVRSCNWANRVLGFPAHLVDHGGLSVTLTDNQYFVKSSVRNLTGKTLKIRADAWINDSAGLLSFSNLLTVGLLTSEQLFRVRCREHVLDVTEVVELAPHDEICFEVAEVNGLTGAVKIPHKFGTTDYLSGSCRLVVKIYGAGIPHVYNIGLVKNTEPGDLVTVRQQGGLNEGSQVLDLKLNSYDGTT